MPALIDHQTRFLSHALGGPPNPGARTLREAHAHVGVKSRDFDEVAEILGEVLEDGGVSEADRLTILELIETTRADVLNT